MAMLRLFAFLIAFCAMSGLLGQGVAAAHGVPAAAAMQGCAHMTAMKHSRSMHHDMAEARSMEGCDDCPMTGHRGKPCPDTHHCLAMPGTALALPAAETVSPAPRKAAQRHLALLTAELSGLAAPPFTEPPILSA
ncbi:hypothetical protein [Novosphingobium beihaiensis]|uniref:Uncharacterized protein n=1 Tax=Novosphingobium beihaiensis TaxID=2930389 RepID=A0ABT0BRR2_9SPHN|nr:hypothetical protein [Novosphingobium beihaiensis]MCJ2187658.1 hypothetical protein [Novosphingobium beihaiensis]